MASGKVIRTIDVVVTGGLLPRLSGEVGVATFAKTRVQCAERVGEL